MHGKSRKKDKEEPNTHTVQMLPWVVFPGSGNEHGLVSEI